MANMVRHSFIASRLRQRLVLVIGVVLILLAIVTCSMRIARLWYAADLQGGGTWHQMTIEHGRLVWDAESSPTMTPGSFTQPVLNWQIELGFAWTTYRSVTQTFTIAGTHVKRSREIAVAAPLTLIGIVCLILSIPWRRKRNGFCACGYNLTGLQSGQCPECGSRIDAGARA